MYANLVVEGGSHARGGGSDGGEPAGGGLGGIIGSNVPLHGPCSHITGAQIK